jgi:hypothetical protein
VAEPVGRWSREPQPPPADAEQLVFCGYCAARPEDGAGELSRVCGQCHLGLLLRATSNLAPGPDDGFLVVDDLLRVRAVSKRAERLLCISETTAVDRQLGELLLPAGTPSVGSLRAAIVQGMVGDGAFRLVVRPRDVHGVRYGARIGPCQPGPAALIVLGDVA